MKRCSKCKVTKPEEEFHRHSRARDGLQGWCKQCTNSRGRPAKSRTRLSWVALRQRCNNPKHVHFPLYGGRGIKVCERWARFESFLADMGERPAGMTIDRIDPNGNYTPENCRWATTTEQNRGRRHVGKVAFGRKQTLPEWATEYGMSLHALHGRLYRGMTLEQALLYQPEPRAPLAPTQERAGG